MPWSIVYVDLVGVGPAELGDSYCYRKKDYAATAKLEGILVGATAKAPVFRGLLRL